MIYSKINVWKQTRMPENVIFIMFLTESCCTSFVFLFCFFYMNKAIFTSNNAEETQTAWYKLQRKGGNILLSWERTHEPCAPQMLKQNAMVTQHYNTSMCKYAQHNIFQLQTEAASCFYMATTSSVHKKNAFRKENIRVATMTYCFTLTWKHLVIMTKRVMWLPIIDTWEGGQKQAATSRCGSVKIADGRKFQWNDSGPVKTTRQSRWTKYRGTAHGPALK